MSPTRSPLPVLFALVVALAMPAVSSAETKRYRFDPVHSQVVFFVSHLGFSHGIGRLRIGSGSFRFDPDDWSSAHVDVVVDLTSLDMGDAKWTETVRSRQFLHVDRHPGARYRSIRVEKTGTATGRIHGELELHGKRQPLDLDVRFNRAGRDPYAFKDKAGFTATATLDRFDYAVDRYRDIVGATIELRIEVEGIAERSTDKTE